MRVPGTAIPRAALLALLVALVIARAPAAHVAAQSLEHWTARAELRIGSVNDAAQAMTTVTQVLVGPAGQLFVAQPVDMIIRVFDAAGRPVRSIGRRGSGPGEFEMLGAIGLLGDTLYTTDDRLRRISLFSLDGRYLTSFQAASPLIDDSQPPMYLPAVPQRLLPDGTALVQPAVPVAHQARGTVTRIPLLRIDRAGRLLDTLVWQTLPRGVVEINSRGNRFAARRPFPDDPIAVVLADGSGVAIIERPVAQNTREAAFRVIKVSLTGDTVFTRAHRYTPVPVPDAVVTRAVADIMQSLSRRPSPPGEAEVRQALRSGGHVPRTLPPVTEAFPGDDGSIWLRRERLTAGDATWNVLDLDGALLATLTLPDRGSIRAVRGNLLVMLELDDADVPFLLLYRLEGRSGSERGRVKDELRVL